MSREIEGRANYMPIRMLDFSGWDDGVASRRSLGALPQPTVQCTASQAAGERLSNDWNTLWDRVTNYPTLSKALRDRIWSMYQAAQTWFDNAWSAGGVWCATKEMLDKYAADLAQATGMLEQEVTSRGLTVGTAPVTAGSTRRAELPEERITGTANWWGLTVGVAALAGVAMVVAKRQRGLGDLDCPGGCAPDSAFAIKGFRRRYQHG